MQNVGWLEEAGWGSFDGCVHSMVALPSGGFATGNDSGSVWLWDAHANIVTVVRVGRHALAALACWPSGEIVSASLNGEVEVWRGSTRLFACTGHVGKVVSAAVSPSDGMFATGAYDRTVKVWHPASGACIATLRGHMDWVYAVCWPSDDSLVTGSWDRTVRVWARRSWACVTIHRHPGAVLCLTPLPKGGFAVGGGPGGAGFVSAWRDGRQAWTATMPQNVEQLTAHKGLLFACASGQVFTVREGSILQRWVASKPHIAALADGSVAVVELDEYLSHPGGTCRVFRAGRVRLSPPASTMELLR